METVSDRKQQDNTRTPGQTGRDDADSKAAYPGCGQHCALRVASVPSRRQRCPGQQDYANQGEPAKQPTLGDYGALHANENQRKHCVDDDSGRQAGIEQPGLLNADGIGLAEPDATNEEIRLHDGLYCSR